MVIDLKKIFKVFLYLIALPYYFFLAFILFDSLTWNSTKVYFSSTNILVSVSIVILVTTTLLIKNWGFASKVAESLVIGSLAGMFGVFLAPNSCIEPSIKPFCAKDVGIGTPHPEYALIAWMIGFILWFVFFAAHSDHGYTKPKNTLRLKANLK
ncbi:MAG: hypothetical protein BWY68_00457 [bacterium ADurb.Bin400]|nr:MAG: hypothetical protein BWY68_00457 [bacterium ADurb.Bin400]